TMVPMMAITASAVDGTVVTTASELTAALKDGGNIVLGADIKSSMISSGYFSVSKDTTIYGEGHRIYAGGYNAHMLRVAKNVTFNAENVVFDCNKKAYMAVSAITESPNGCTINLTNCTVKNSYNRSSSSTYPKYPAVYYFGDAKGTLTNCTFTGNTPWDEASSGADVWAGGASDVTIIGGAYDEIYVNGTAGSITLDGNAVVAKANGELYTINNAIVEGDIYVDGVKTTEAITTLEQLKTAAANGGTYALGADIEVSEQVDVKSPLTLYGNRKTLKSTKTKSTMLNLSGLDSTVTVIDATLDVNGNDTWAVSCSKNGGNNPNNVITLTDCTVKNAVSSSYVGAINQFGSSTGYYNNCTFTNNVCQVKFNDVSGADVWAGAKAKVYINGGTYDEVYLNANTSSGASGYVSGGAVIDTFNLGFGSPNVEITDGSTVNTLTKWDDVYSGTHYEGTYTVDETSTIGVAYTYVDNETALKDVITKGVAIRICSDFEVTEKVTVSNDLTIDGNGKTIKANGTEYIFDTANTPVVLTFNNLTLDCNNVAHFAIHTSEESVANQDTAVKLTDCTVKNSIGDYYNHAAVYLYSRATGYFENCTFENNTLTYDGEWAYANGADIWSGAATNVTIDGGSYSQVFINANRGVAGQLTVEGDAAINELTLESDGKTATAAIADTATVTKVNVGTTEAVVTEDGKIIGTSGECATPDADDTFSNNLPADQKFTKNFELMGAQRKANDENAIRFVSVIDADLIAAADDYGYIIGTTTKDKLTAMQNAGNITLDNVPHLAVSCKETSNQLSGDYGLYDTDTNYKYVTAAIENITDPSLTILARVYVKCGDKTYYGDYITASATYAGCATSLVDFPVA
ncbi:MAG: hypothetical protein ACI4Q8_01655, partial [Ruminococcus sp.]